MWTDSIYILSLTHMRRKDDSNTKSKSKVVGKFKALLSCKQVRKHDLG